MRRESKAGLPMAALGLLLIAAALGLIGYNMRQDERAGAQSQQVAAEISGYIPDRKPAAFEPDLSDPYFDLPDYVLNPEMEMPEQEINGYDYIAMLSIPSVSIELPVMGRWDYDRLRVAPCRYTGSVYTNDLVIAGHNYVSHFWPLHDLLLGADVYLTDMDGNVFSYVVREITNLDPDAHEEMIGSGWDLTLFTCTFGGSYRLTVRCELLS